MEIVDKVPNMVIDLELKLRITESEEFIAEFYEPESGNFQRYTFTQDDLNNQSPEFGKFNRIMGEEIESWFSILKDRIADAEEE